MSGQSPMRVEHEHQGAVISQGSDKPWICDTCHQPVEIRIVETTRIEKYTIEEEA